MLAGFALELRIEFGPRRVLTPLSAGFGPRRVLTPLSAGAARRDSFSCLRPNKEPVGDNERTLKAFLFAAGRGVGETGRCCCESIEPARMLRFIVVRPAVSDAEGLRFFLKLLSESESLAGTDGGGKFFASLALAEDCMVGNGPFCESSSGLCGRLDIAPPAAAAGKADPLEAALACCFVAGFCAVYSD